MINRPINLNNKSWRRYIPAHTYRRIQALGFRGANRMRCLLGLTPIDTEIWISKAIVHFSQPRSYFIDVGAQHGRHIRFFLEKGNPETFIIACEANPELTRKLGTCFEEQIKSRRITVLNNAIGADNSLTDFFINTSDSGYSGLKARNIIEVADSYTCEKVEQLTIDTLAATLPHPISCIKIDVEGAEFNVFQGALKTINKDKPAIIFECVNNAAPFYDTDLSKIKAWLEKQGYTLLTLSGIPIHKTDDAEQVFKQRLCCDFVAVHEELEMPTSHFLRQFCDKG